MLFNVRKLRGCHWVISLVCRTRSRKFHLSNCLHELFFLSVLLWRVDTLLEVLCREDFHIKSTNVVLLLGVKKQFWYLLGYQASKALQRELLRHLLEYWSENNYDRRYSTINFTSRRYSKSVSYCIVSELIPPRGEKKTKQSTPSKQDLDISSLNFCRAPLPCYVKVPLDLTVKLTHLLWPKVSNTTLPH